ncbi:TfoX/Sxy family protein [Tessaracoccus sp. OH4464_COT-324]|uniref:TfoX/Sxy family protein n=1 Tax=Tessaracoccus sp. OH4464_COT-324 TaxID=2491059 RepID=UPI000F639F41|nr:TfoX/Sxy family protein [Tessaracoccus sp. OH4464_COT-324]RRD45871.1 transcriptional regulator [Tessaracoccus sp. OH4464_COT-324]
MASTADHLAWVLDLLRELDGVSSRRMMGEYVLYCDGKVFGGIYDDRFLVKDIPAARELLPDAPAEEPYPGGSPMLLVTVEDPTLVAQLVRAMLPQLPSPKRRR